MAIDFALNEQGLFCHRDGRTEKVCDQPVEYVAYSDLDHELYVRWPGDGPVYQMAALPLAALEEPGRLRLWADCNELPLARGMEDSIADYLRRETERHFNN